MAVWTNRLRVEGAAHRIDIAVQELGLALRLLRAAGLSEAAERIGSVQDTLAHAADSLRRWARQLP